MTSDVSRLFKMLAFNTRVKTETLIQLPPNQFVSVPLAHSYNGSIIKMIDGLTFFVPSRLSGIHNFNTMYNTERLSSIHHIIALPSLDPVRLTKCFQDYKEYSQLHFSLRCPRKNSVLRCNVYLHERRLWLCSEKSVGSKDRSNCRGSEFWRASEWLEKQIQTVEIDQTPLILSHKFQESTRYRRSAAKIENRQPTYFFDFDNELWQWRLLLVRLLLCLSTRLCVFISLTRCSSFLLSISKQVVDRPLVIIHSNVLHNRSPCRRLSGWHGRVFFFCCWQKTKRIAIFIPDDFVVSWVSPVNNLCKSASSSSSMLSMLITKLWSLAQAMMTVELVDRLQWVKPPRKMDHFVVSNPKAASMRMRNCDKKKLKWPFSGVSFWLPLNGVKSLSLATYAASPTR